MAATMTPGQSFEFLADISSFANTSGGDLVIGIDAKDGVPTAFNPFPEAADRELCRLDQMAQSGLEPRIPKLQTHSVPVASGGSVLIIRATRSYNAPHRVIFKGRNRFWARSAARKYEPNVDELRAMFTLAPRLADRMRDFRMERIARIAVLWRNCHKKFDGRAPISAAWQKFVRSRRFAQSERKS
jgi:hypothetical protein